MKLIAWIAITWALAQSAWAGEASLIKSYQPLVGHSTLDIVIAEVTCLQWYSSSASSALALIAARNIPPTDMPEYANSDLNIASICGLKIFLNDQGVQNPPPPEVTFDATGWESEESLGVKSEDERSRVRTKIIRASLECVRRCLVDRKQAGATVKLVCKEADKPWLEKIVAEFNAHERAKEFFKSLEGF